MSQSVTATITAITKARFQATQPLSTTFTGIPLVSWVKSFLTTDITQCYFHTYAITTTPTLVDLTSLTDAFGTALAFTDLQHIVIVNHDTTNTLTIGGGTNAVITTLPPLTGATGSNNSADGSCCSLTTAITVDSSHKILRLLSNAGTITTDVFLLGN